MYFYQVVLACCVLCCSLLQEYPNCSLLLWRVFCGHANDEQFRFCQSCGYVRAQVGESEYPVTQVPIHPQLIAERLEQLSKQRGSSRYMKQKSSLAREFCMFLSSKSPSIIDVGPFLATLLNSLFGKTEEGRPMFIILVAQT